MHPHTKLREQYAKERTILSIDRTILSYARTSLTMTVVGITFIKFFDSPILQVVGLVFIVLAVILMAFGAQRGVKSHQKIQKYSISQSSE